MSKLESWALAWQTKFNVDKCTVMHIGSGNKKCSYQNSLLEFTGTQKDLQIWISNDLKFEFHTLEACKKANKMLGMIKRTDIHKDPRILVSIYKSLVRLHLEYCCSAWARGAVKTATNYNGDKPKRRHPERRQNGKTKTATHLNGDNENGDSFRIRCWRYCYMLCYVMCLFIIPSSLFFVCYMRSN